MSRRRSRGSLRPLAQLLPYLRPYLGRMALLLIVTLAFAFSDAGRALLAKPLLNKVFMRGREVRGHVEDEARLARHPVAVREAGAAEGAAFDEAWGAARSLDEVQKVRRSPDLLGATAFRTPEGAEGRRQDYGALLARTADVLLKTADAVPSDQVEAWRTLTRAARIQSAAIARFRAADPTTAEGRRGLRVSGELSYQARQLAHDAGFQVAWETLWWVFWVAIVLAVALAAFNFAMLFLSRTLVARVFVDLQNKTAEHLLTLSVRFFEGEQRGDLLARLIHDLRHTSNLFTTVLDVVIRLLHLLVLVVLAVAVSWQLSLILIGLAVTIVLPIRWWGKRIRRSARKRQGVTGQVIETMQQMFSGIREVKAFRREDYEGDRFQATAHQALRADIKTIQARVASKTWLRSFNEMLVPILFALGGWLVLTRTAGIDVGTFGAFLGLVMLMYQPAKILAQGYGQIMDGLPALERVFQLFAMKAEIVDQPDAVGLSSIEEGIRCEEVSYAYDPAGDAVLSGISLEAKPGTVTALVGPTGSGKSTLIDLIARFCDPTAGQVFVDGVDLKAVRVQDYRAQVAVVPQDSFLFNDTIRQNIRYGRLEATDAEVEEAAKKAQIHDEILGLPDGYDYVAGERGGRLSGGQIQRLAIARAILKRPRVLILDEAASALDTGTEARVQAALEELRAGAITFVVAHRLSTVQEADQILVLGDGKILEQGRHTELLEQRGAYAQLVQRELN